MCDLSAVTPAIDHAGFPIDSLHWDSVISADTVETWHDNFLDFDISARMHWAEPADLMPGHMPVTGDWNLRYRDLLNTLYLAQGEFETPTTRGTCLRNSCSEEHESRLAFERRCAGNLE